MADHQFTTWVVLGDGDECKAEFGNIRGRDLPLELRCIACNREDMCKESRGSF